MNSLDKISKFYETLQSNSYKKRLLFIACGISRVPLHNGVAYDIEREYWFVELLILKQELNNPKSLTFFLENTLQNHFKIINESWEGKSAQAKNIHDKVALPTFKKYYNVFMTGIYPDYQMNQEIFGYNNSYERNIKTTIVGLSVAYDKIKTKEYKQEACNIAQALCKSYQLKTPYLTRYFLFYQKKLIALSKLVNEEVRAFIFYYSVL